MRSLQGVVNARWHAFRFEAKIGPPHDDTVMTLRAKPGLVLVPGLLCDELMWRPQLAALAEVADCWVAHHTRSETLADVAADVPRGAPFEKLAHAGTPMRRLVALEILP